MISIMARKGMVVRGVRVRSEKWADHSLAELPMMQNGIQAC